MEERSSMIFIPAKARGTATGTGLYAVLGALVLGGSFSACSGAAGAARVPPKSAAVPVGVVAAEKRDVPVYLTGLGNVTAFNTVTVKSRVDGQIVEVAFREGQDVKKGDLLVVIDPRPFEVQREQAEANLARDQAQLANDLRDLDRYKDLIKDGVIPAQQLDTQRALVAQFQAAIGVDQAQIDTAKLNLEFCRITSPVDGRVGLRLVDVGNVVHATDTAGLLVVTQLQPISVIFTLPEDNLQMVARALSQGNLAAEAWSRDDLTKLDTGTLLTIDNQIDIPTGTGRLKAVFENKTRALWPNQFVNLRLLVEVRKDKTVVPSAAIQHGPEGSFAYVMQSDHTIAVKPVKVGIVQTGVAVMESGISPGDEVIVDGQEKIQAGTLVEPRDAARAAAPNAAS